MKSLGWYHTGDVWADRDFDEKYENINAPKPFIGKKLSSYCIQLCETKNDRYFVRLQKGNGWGVGVWHIWIERGCEYGEGVKMIREIRRTFPSVNKENRDEVWNFIRNYPLKNSEEETK